MPVSVTAAIIAVTVAVSLIGFNNPKWVSALILWPPAVERDRDYFRLVSYGLLHADMSHLLFNMLTLYFFGRAMEGFYTRLLGPLGFLFFYVLGLLLSILPSYLRHRGDAGYRSLGASGAVSAVLFAYILLRPWDSIYLYFAIKVPAIVFAVAYIAYSVYMDRRGGDNINHSAHLWGAAYGVLFTIAVEPGLLAHFLEQLAAPF